MRILFAAGLLLPLLANAAETLPAGLAEADAAWNRLRERAEAAALAPLIDPDFVLVHSDGRVQHKADYLADLSSKSRVNNAILNQDVRTRVYGDTAIVNGVSVQSGTSQGQPWSGRFVFTRVWQLRGGQWLLLSSHSSRVSAP
ncbi:nuclear transport factor 2 family protein [Massilia sp. TS11]|uniref:nuclear transport factor 2 family protein n=1 Tax=Massilia sp. TS11 TaxID=2908003 RepID=UPI001EDC5E87|nr:nuclear transport factor 2 family protein [Massilia sp. TS11]MCG2585144.1 nuclear transport factor 2 family protein [Massilia sp. TS11]